MYFNYYEKVNYFNDYEKGRNDDIHGDEQYIDFDSIITEEDDFRVDFGIKEENEWTF